MELFIDPTHIDFYTDYYIIPTESVSFKDRNI